MIFLENAPDLSWPAFVGIITSCLSVVVSALIGWYVKNSLDDRKQKRGKAEQLMQKEHDMQLKDDIDADINEKFDQLNASIEALAAVNDAIKDDLELTKQGLQSQLRHAIREACRRCLEIGGRTIDDTVEIEKMHESYEKLGENNVTNRLYDDFLKLAIISDEEEAARLKARLKSCRRHTEKEK